MTSRIPVSTIQRLVMRDVQPGEAGSVATLNDLPEWMLEEVRDIAREHRLGAVRYLKFYVKLHEPPNVEDFVEEVLRNGQDPQTWGTRDWLCILRDQTPLTCLHMSIKALHAMSELEGERWFRFEPEPTKHLSDEAPGAIGVLRKQIRYWQHTRIVGVDYYSTNCGTIQPVPADQLESSFRRWIARRMAQWAKQYLVDAGAMVAAQGIIDAIAQGEQVEITRDAEIAAAALAREARAHGGEPDFVKRAGYLGPDSWYAE